ncbi:hypothetical protein GCM10010399_28950 [Dactylosporangium fulvum]|uniref:DUF2267 domain-containing protein n=1 Tax=Dactylosporangium fulvum TaxID=53359 RepID=A0ABY5W8N5_9ACTN|nr:DUF2267 domain-containing protein [Dactylosporangium fulvum]UWP86237.1 DUF2267 domain-containing protein [Dactylosporangium fulvum]
MDEREFAAAVAQRAGLAKEEAADLVRGTLEEVGNQISGGEVKGLALELPADLAGHLPRHDGRSRPVPLQQFIRRLSERTGLNENDVSRGVGAILSGLERLPDGGHVRHALSQLPSDYRQLMTTG